MCKLFWWLFFFKKNKLFFNLHVYLLLNYFDGILSILSPMHGLFQHEKAVKLFKIYFKVEIYAFFHICQCHPVG